MHYVRKSKEPAFDLLTYTITIGSENPKDLKSYRVKKERMWGIKSLIWEAQDKCKMLKGKSWWKIECAGKLLDEGGALDVMNGLKESKK